MSIIADDELAKEIERGLNKKLRQEERGAPRFVMKTQYELDDDAFETFEAQCGNCAHFYDHASRCGLKDRVVKETGLCELHRYRRR